MSETDQGEVIEAHVEDGEVRYTAEYPDGSRVSGVITRQIRPYTRLSDKALKQMADELVGTSIDSPPESQNEFSIGR